MTKKDINIFTILRVSIFSLILIAMLSGFAFAQTVILNQVPNQLSALLSDPSYPLIPTQSVAENFIVSSTVNVTQIRIWGTYITTQTPPATDYFTVIFHADSGGLPGAAISTQNNVPVSRQSTGGSIAAAMTEYVFTLTLATPVTLTPGTYWVEIYNDTSADTDDDFCWEIGNLDPTNGISNSARSSTVPGSVWNLVGAPINPAIEITSSTSIPTINEWGMIIFMLLAGLGAVYYLRRQRRAES